MAVPVMGALVAMRTVVRRSRGRGVVPSEPGGSPCSGV